jgi:uncharacterized protein
MDKEHIEKLIKTHPEQGVDGREWCQAGMDAYLDIETTGLSPSFDQITIVGIYLIKGKIERLVQIVGYDITAASITQSLDGVSSIFTYNGSHFDLPFIYARHKVDLARDFKHCDLMYHCWGNNLYGGLKAVECQLGINRLSKVNGYEAVRLWWSYVNDYDEAALNTLLEYNKEDVLNLRTLRDRLVEF